MDKPQIISPKRGPGRETLYSEELADELCMLLATSENRGMYWAASQMGISRQTVYTWLGKYPEFLDKYTRARALQQELCGEMLAEISEDENIPVDRARLMIDTRKWLMSKLAPKKYGDKVQQEISGSGGGPITFVLERVGDKSLDKGE